MKELIKRKHKMSLKDETQQWKKKKGLTTTNIIGYEQHLIMHYTITTCFFTRLPYICC